MTCTFLVLAAINALQWSGSYTRLVCDIHTDGQCSGRNRFMTWNITGVECKVKKTTQLPLDVAMYEREAIYTSFSSLRLV